MNSQQKGFWFVVGFGVNALIWCLAFGLHFYFQDSIKPGDIIESWNSETTKYDSAVVITVENTEYSQEYMVYPIKIENWNFQKDKPQVRKISNESKYHY